MCQQFQRNPANLSPVHTSNTVEATFDFVATNGNSIERVYRIISSFDKVECCFDIVETIVKLVAFDNVAWTLLLVWTWLYGLTRSSVALVCSAVQTFSMQCESTGGAGLWFLDHRIYKFLPKYIIICRRSPGCGDSALLCSSL